MDRSKAGLLHGAFVGAFVMAAIGISTAGWGQAPGAAGIHAAPPDAAVLEWRQPSIHLFKLDEKTGSFSETGTAAGTELPVPMRIYRFTQNNYVEVDVAGARVWIKPEAIRRQKPERLATCATHGAQMTGGTRFGSEGC